MKRLGISLVIAMLTISTLVVGGEARSPATPAASPEACPITQPNMTETLPMRLGGPGGYGNDALWTNLWMWGENGIVHAPRDERIDENGVIHGMKWAWYRFKPGELTITGRRLDAPADPLTAWIPDGYGDTGFQVAGITFPSVGCWEITGHLGSDSLTFVVWVEIVASWFEATPAA